MLGVLADPQRSSMQEHESGGYELDPVLMLSALLWEQADADERSVLQGDARLEPIFPIHRNDDGSVVRVALGEGTTTDRSPALARTIVELLPGVHHDTTQYANNQVEADHGRLKASLRPMRGLKRDQTASVVIRGHAFMQNLRRGQHEGLSWWP